MRNATIADNGKLTKAHEDLKDILPTKLDSTGNDRKTVLLLGSGMVAGPLVEHLASRPDVKIVVGNCLLFYLFCVYILNMLGFLASNVVEEAKSLIAGHHNAESTSLDISNNEDLSRLVSKADVVVR